jgi:hypothetical protein
MFGDRPGETSTWKPWPDPYGPYMVGLHFTEIDGRSELVGVELWSGGPPPDRYREEDRAVVMDPARQPGRGGPLPAVALRQLPIGRLADAVRRHRLDMANLVIELYDSQRHPPETLERAERTFRAVQASRPRGGRKPTYGPEHYAEVARIYTAAWRSRASPTKAVEAWGSVSYTTAAKWVAKARALGLLPPTTKGRPSKPAAPEHEQRPSGRSDGEG